ncbi:MAG: Transcription antitermination protein nusG [Candidatus Azambacteria bacterium GW2011_GWB1_46_27]|uniref:Transcription termination/antitermination protein NusG n=2 Tax=Candidatus Azamiibacteriota TaxID=1752741 RepID=A0A0G1PTZ7_9BACT|nr:MAG: Transcription antitermination protein nusG [Candidatus Azambacteria bacterium GW2011_GWB1_46_27]
MPKQQAAQEKHWYVIHTYSGYEDAVARNLKQRIESLDMGDKIFSVLVPKEKKIKIKHGKRKVVEERIYPGYVLVEMIVTDDSWYVVRNTPRVTGFIGSGTMPIPISEEEIAALQKRMGIEEPKYKIDVAVGDAVKITDGPFKDFDGKISEVDEDRGKVWFQCSAAKLPLNWTFCKLKRFNAIPIYRDANIRMHANDTNKCQY